MSKIQINIKKLSELVGVAPSTISRIMSGKAKSCRISEKTEQRVLAKARELGFRPNYFAHSLNTGKTHNIGLVFANRVDTFLGRIMEGVEAFFRDTDYQMVVATCENDPQLEKEEISRMLYRQVDGVILYPSAVKFDRHYSTEHLKQPSQKPTPYVIIGRQIDLTADYVLFSDYQAGHDAADDFLNAGAEKFGMITMPIKCSANMEREKGFVENLKKCNVDPEKIIIVGNNNESMETQVQKIAGVNHIWAVNAGIWLKYFAELIKIRETSDLNIITVGDIEYNDLINFNFKARPMPAWEMGNKAAEILFQRMEKMDDDFYKILLSWPK